VARNAITSRRSFLLNLMTTQPRRPPPMRLFLALRHGYPCTEVLTVCPKGRPGATNTLAEQALRFHPITDIATASDDGGP
jgi:hypothetical protein